VRQTKVGAWQSVVGRDAEGLELHRQLSGGLRLDWEHDAAGRPTGQRFGTGSGPARRRRYQWQGADQLAEIEDSTVGPTRYTYDALGTLTGATYANGGQDVRQPDAVGNLFRTGARTDRTYGKGGQLREANGTRYTYDAEGNLTRKNTPDGQQWHYVWDGAGQLAEVKRPDGYAVTFAYDALGRRVSKRFRGRVTKWVWDANKPLHEWTELEVGPGAGSAGEVLTWLFEEESFVPTTKLTAQEAQSVVCDHLGTPLALYDSQGRATWEMTLDSCGGVRQTKGKPQDCPFRYQGQYEDIETGLYYNRFRYYDPCDGCYISQDPIRLQGGIQLYAYVKNPSAYSDILGLTGAPGVTWVDPKTLNFSQGYVDTKVYDIMQKMDDGVWDWTREDAILNVTDVNGQLVSLDNRRLLAAQLRGVEKVPIRMVNPDDVMKGGGTYGKNLQGKLNSRPPKRPDLSKKRLPPEGTPNQPEIVCPLP
jgi:RHS repeat-associated protein